MKFLALALTILLVAGSQALPMQADAPSQLEHVKAAMAVYLTQVKETAQRSINLLDDTEYKEYKMHLSKSLESLQEYADKAGPVGDAFGSQLAEATAAVRAEIMKDVEDLRTQLAPKRAELKEVLEKHMAEYREKMEPIVKEIMEKRRAEMEALQIKMEPVIEEMRAKVAHNVEETKSKLMPIVEAVRAKLTERLEELRTMAAPYADEYKEQVMKAVGELRGNIDHEKIQSQMSPVMDEVKEKFLALYEAVKQSVSA
ncbi:hypothetical protein DPEC_G00298040 [Dallia pectoralis]|uniref:Uncharacterized protein n=1 Tax=Dallia pectoralis TaxID=75939 RepID=A0ACC2FFU8_DALPE|nr:hypothetical protein DPEC_G00298040 [Dallia pectoralis]